MRAFISIWEYSLQTPAAGIAYRLKKETPLCFQYPAYRPNICLPNQLFTSNSWSMQIAMPDISFSDSVNVVCSVLEL